MSEDLFYCEALRCTLSERACAKRCKAESRMVTATKAGGAFGLLGIGIGPCGTCAAGAARAAAILGERVTLYQPRNRGAYDAASAEDAEDAEQAEAARPRLPPRVHRRDVRARHARAGDPAHGRARRHGHVGRLRRNGVVGRDGEGGRDRARGGRNQGHGGADAAKPGHWHSA